MSGIYAAHLIAHQRIQSVSLQAAADIYQKFLSEWMAHDMAALQGIRWYQSLHTAGEPASA